MTTAAVTHAAKIKNQSDERLCWSSIGSGTACAIASTVSVRRCLSIQHATTMYTYALNHSTVAHFNARIRGVYTKNFALLANSTKHSIDD